MCIWRGRPCHGKRRAPLDLVTVAGAAPPAKKPVLSKLKALVEREGLDPAPDKRRVPLRQQAAASAHRGTAAAGKARPAPQYRSVYDIPSLPGQQAKDVQRPGLGPLPRPDFSASKYPPPQPPQPQPWAAQHADLRPEDSLLAPDQPRQPATAPVPVHRKVVQVSPAAGRKGAAGPAWVRRRAVVAVPMDEVCRNSRPCGADLCTSV